MANGKALFTRVLENRTMPVPHPWQNHWFIASPSLQEAARFV
ncbi:MAG TPA: hypothetical protein VKM55_02320 [Candidatus Lokiarchaeia archaeon]|nr:hypothetical protein [Candidatus Lokiarchaeia archaeon]